MKHFFTAVLILMMIQVNAQVLLEGTVIDSKTQKAIPYLNIGIVELSRGTVSDHEGRFTLEAKSQNDTVVFSGIGYETVEMNAAAIVKYRLIALTPKAYHFDAIEIVADKYEKKDALLGVKNKKRGESIAFGSAQLGTEIGAAIRIDRPTYLKSANFVLNHAKGDSLLLRVNIYEFKDGQIGKNILPENVMIREKQRKGIFTVDLKDYNLVVKSDVLLSLEWLRNYDEVGNKGITFDTKKSKHLRGIYAKHSSNGEFKILSRLKKRKPCFYFIASQSKK